MAHSELQKLQKARSYFKFVITGLYRPVNNSYLTVQEQAIWSRILDLRKELLLLHDDTSREMGLNVPLHRCIFTACRKEGIHLSRGGYLCNKHFKQEQEDDT